MVQLSSRGCDDAPCSIHSRSNGHRVDGFNELWVWLRFWPRDHSRWPGLERNSCVLESCDGQLNPGADDRRHWPGGPPAPSDRSSASPQAGQSGRWDSRSISDFAESKMCVHGMDSLHVVLLFRGSIKKTRIRVRGERFFTRLI